MHAFLRSLSALYLSLSQYFTISNIDNLLVGGVFNHQHLFTVHYGPVQQIHLVDKYVLSMYNLF